ncbi:hypothetical protein [Maritimibacter dapengensis]|uniref:Uncharacterized protein n=1 Tax=Maritimibacter dapengensis TaxID=2836868 RepID=A0ABS6T781_9RHOB|nr:hypothetical protein [Maritimibacter dapengensis]MBV7380805.1 hypothetical protein [Maritimibacter dapengensis]
MKYGWKLLLIPIWALSIAGAVVIAGLSIGAISWVTFAVAAVVGLVLGIPAGIWNTRKIRREDPNWENGRYVPA